MKFPYLRFDIEPTATFPDGILHRPIIPLYVSGPMDRAMVWALLDSGADETLFPRSVADDVGATIDESLRWPVAGIAGQEIEAVAGDIVLEVFTGRTTLRWSQRIGFVEFKDPEDEIAILGHAGFLNYFASTFDGAKKEVTLTQKKRRGNR